MKREGNLYEKICDFENLYQAYLEARRGKRYRNDVLKYTANLEENLIQIQNELLYDMYRVGKYREFYVYEPKKRLVMALPFKDRIVQWAIYRQLYPIFSRSFIQHSYACQEGRGTHAAAKNLQNWLRIVSKKPGKWYYLKLDVSKYFYRVDHKILINIMARKIKDKRVLRLLWTIIKSETTKFGLPTAASLTETDVRLEDRGMPIGNLTSQLFANVYLNELDQFAKHTLGLRYYTRYMDDVILLHDDKKELQRIKTEIERFLNEELKLDLNNKTCIRPISLGIEFVGFRIWNTHKKIKKHTAQKIRKNLKRIQRKYAAGLMSLDKVKSTLFSYLGMLEHCDSYLLKRKVLHNFKLTRNRDQPRT
ncbi:reverse transcriptase domain-containing protein [Bacillota bacterium Lsc_1132]